MSKRILVINPGSTSTKIAVFEDKKEIYVEVVEHSEEDLAPFDSIVDQFDYRKSMILEKLEENHMDIHKLDAVVGRGGTYYPLTTGGYLVSEAMKDRIRFGDIISHASNLGALIADAIAAPLGIPAYIYDAVASDEMLPIAKITGFPEIQRQCYCHVLNTRAMAREYAESIGKKYEDLNFIVAHIGGGASVNIHEKGRIVDSIGDDDGPFSIERSGGVPLTYVVDMAFSGKYDRKSLSKRLRGMGGMKAHLGTHDCREVEKRIATGDKHAKEIYEALAYQISKGIGQLSPMLCGNVDVIILTGGAARSKMLTDWIAQRVQFIAPVAVMPGEKEMEALALGALRILNGEEKAKEYQGLGERKN